MADGGQTDGCGNMADGLSDGHGDASDGDQTNGCRCLGDNLGIEATHSYQRKMTMTQWTRIRSMTVGAQRMDSGWKAEANHYMRKAWRKGKSLKNVSSQWTGYDLMTVLQRTIKPRVSAEHQTTTCL